MVETELILRLCRTPLPELNRTRAHSAMDAGVSIDTVLTLARAWQVEPVVLANLRELLGDILSAESLALVQQRERDSRALTLGQTLALIDLVRQFTSNGILVIVLKGPAIGVTGYGDPSLRPFADFDLLLRPQDVPRARDLALSLGYRREYLPENERGLIGK